MEAPRPGRTVRRCVTGAAHAACGGSAVQPRRGGARAPAGRCFSGRARERVRGRARERVHGRGRARGAGAHARGGAAPPRGCVIREHRSARARRAAVPMSALAAHAHGRLLARALARHARARASGTSLAPIYASIRVR